jgi:uncharacterized protein YciI
MHPRRLLLQLSLLAVLLPPVAAFAADAAPATAAPKAKPQFVYVLHLVPRLHDDKAWTDADKTVLQRHVANLKAGTERGQVILAGRTLESGDKTFGLVIFTVEDAAAATAFMNSDPCVAEKIMTASVHPYAVAFKAK